MVTGNETVINTVRLDQNFDDKYCYVYDVFYSFFLEKTWQHRAKNRRFSFFYVFIIHVDNWQYEETVLLYNKLCLNQYTDDNKTNYLHVLY